MKILNTFDTIWMPLVVAATVMSGMAGMSGMSVMSVMSGMFGLAVSVSLVSEPLYICLCYRN